MLKRCFVIVNPAAASGRAGNRLGLLRDRLGRFGMADEFHVTRSADDPLRLAYEAARAGFSPIVAAGGDGTAHAVANGVLRAGRGSEIELAFLPMGTGGDAIRNFGLPRKLDACLDLLRDGIPRPVDVGRAEFESTESSPRYFLNSASFGASASVAEAVNRVKADRRSQILGSKGAFALGALVGALQAKRYPLRLVRDGEAWFEGSVTFAAAANGCYFGAGMKLAPDARVDDGALTMVAVPGFPRRTLLRHLPSLYTGRYLDIPGVVCGSGQSLRGEPLGDQQVPVELDGERVGSLPIEIRLQPAALRVLSPR